VVLLNLMSNPPCYRKLQTKIDSAIAAGKISSPIRESEAKRLPYLQAVIKEGLRVNPLATGLFSRQVPKGVDALNGIFVPEGTQIASANYGMFRSKKAFGKDADTFRPERWLEAEGDQLSVI
jgi:cytochrome P450